MSETLLSPSNVLIFGRILEDLNIVAPAGNPTHSPFSVTPRPGPVGHLQESLVLASRKIARIYGCSFENAYYDLPKPVLFLVHGPGTPASEAKGGPGAHNRARSAPQPSVSGLGEMGFQFADDLMVWSYDKDDYTIRLDVEPGKFEDVLLEALLNSGAGDMDAFGSGRSGSGRSGSGRSGSGRSGSGRSGSGRSGG